MLAASEDAVHDDTALTTEAYAISCKIPSSVDDNWDPKIAKHYERSLRVPSPSIVKTPIMTHIGRILSYLNGLP